MGFGRSQRNTALRRIAGVLLALAGVIIIFDKLPPVFWWYFLGALLLAAGFRLFTS